MHIVGTSTFTCNLVAVTSLLQKKKLREVLQNKKQQKHISTLHRQKLGQGLNLDHGAISTPLRSFEKSSSRRVCVLQVYHVSSLSILGSSRPQFAHSDIEFRSSRWLVQTGRPAIFLKALKQIHIWANLLGSIQNVQGV